MWGQMNATFKKNKFLKIFFPTLGIFHKKLIQEVWLLLSIQSYYAKNYLDAKIYKVFTYSFLFLIGLILRGYLLKCIFFLPKILSLTFKAGIRNYILFLILDLISVIAVNKSKNKPEFVILFLNSVAHFQHNHWNDKKKSKSFF